MEIIKKNLLTARVYLWWAFFYSAKKNYNKYKSDNNK